MIQAKGQLSRHHSGPCPRDDTDEALQILRWASRLPQNLDSLGYVINRKQDLRARVVS